MKHHKLTLFCLVILAALFFSPYKSSAQEFDPVGIFLTWQYDPTTSMTIDWHTTSDDGDRPSLLQYKKLGAFPGQPGYGVLDFGDYLSFFLLDSDHANPIQGAQASWLESELRERARRDVSHIIPIYHVPSHPSHRNYESRTIPSVRETWVPLFEQYGVRVSLENHDHTYKRTHPILNGEISENGIMFIGDSAWGVGTRDGNSSDEWYIDRFESVNHAIIGTLDGDVQEYIMVDIDVNEFDSYTDDRRPLTGSS